jgi:hypothetical protein
MSIENVGDGAIRIDDTLVSVLTREQRLSAYTLDMLLSVRDSAVQAVLPPDKKAELDEVIQWLKEKQ